MSVGQWVDHGARVAHHDSIAATLPELGVVTLALKCGTKVRAHVSGTWIDNKDNPLGRRQAYGVVRLEAPEWAHILDFQDIESVLIEGEEYPGGE
jgi:hypothetical protein